MASLLGKRKRRSPPKDLSSTPGTLEADLDYQIALRKHFEAAFEPMEVQNNVEKTSPLVVVEVSTNLSDIESQDTDSSSEWSGLSESEDVQIVSHESVSIFEDSEVSIKSQRKQFMSSKPPATSDKSTTVKSSTKASHTSDLKSAASLTAEDLALQRLLAESHLLSGSASSTLSPSLKARQQAQDLRIQGLGAKKSIADLGSGNVPMSIRKGIESKKHMKERSRRKEAKEAGIVLERKSQSSESRKPHRRARDVGAPAVGRWKGGTLVLGKKDVAEIEGQRLASDFGKKGRKAKKGKRR